MQVLYVNPRVDICDSASLHVSVCHCMCWSAAECCVSTCAFSNVLSVHVALMYNAKGIYAGMQEQAHSPHSVSSPVRRGSALGPSPLSMKGRPSHGHSNSMGSVNMGSSKSLNTRQGFNQVWSQPRLACRDSLPHGVRELICLHGQSPAYVIPLGRFCTM